MNAIQRTTRLWLCVGLVALVLSGVVRHQVEARRKEAHLTFAETDKNALEVGFLALGGFRGILADVLWVRAIRLQDSARYYELKLLCDMILRLQPTFAQVHAFQAYNLSYNLAYRAETAEDKWYWIRSGLATLERGLDRNARHYSLWFELGYQYFDRLGDTKLAECREIMLREMPRLEDLTEEQRRHVFSGEKTWQTGRARRDEPLRFAAYCFWKAMQTGTDPAPLRTERQFGQCIERLGHWRSKKPPAECKSWDDWGSEDWWRELIRRDTQERGITQEDNVPNNLKFCLYQQMDFYMLQAARLTAQNRVMEAGVDRRRAEDAYARFQKDFPDNKLSMEGLLKKYRDYRDIPRLGQQVRKPITPSDE